MNQELIPEVEECLSRLNLNLSVDDNRAFIEQACREYVDRENEELRQLNKALLTQYHILIEQRDRVNDMHQFEESRAEKEKKQSD